MVYTALDNFYLTDEELQSTPSRRDGIGEATETTLRRYGCDRIQESCILLRLPQAVMATGQVLFHRFYCKKSFARFNVKIVAASCVWLASKMEESPRKARQVIFVFHRMARRRENLPIEDLDLFSKKYTQLKMDLSRTERHILIEMGFICHVEHPHKFILHYLDILGTPPELRQLSWNLANDSLRTTLCVQFKSEVVACGVVYAAARKFEVPLPENPPWWKVFDAEKSGIDEVCRVLGHLYSLPKAQYKSVCRDGDFSFSEKPKELKSQEGLRNSPRDNDNGTQKADSGQTNMKSDASKGSAKASLDKMKESSKSDDESKNLPAEGEARSKSGYKSDSVADRSKERNRSRERERDRYRERSKPRDLDRERDRDDNRVHRSTDSRNSGGHLEKSGLCTRDRDYRSPSYSSREKERHRY